MSTDPHRYVGLISGTSVDGIDAVVLEIDNGNFSVLASELSEYPSELRTTLLTLAQPGDNEIDQLGQADRQVGDCFAAAALSVIALANLTPADIRAIGSHGQTLRHRPGLAHPFTLQIGDPNRITERAGVTTVADFRRRDMAAGGQGAPLASGFHRAAFARDGEATAILNLGGIANATLFTGDGAVLGFDTGPANTLMNAWIDRHHGEPFDRDGAWAAKGQVIDPLLTNLLKDPYFALRGPRSTGPEYFNLAWLEGHLAGLGESVSATDVQRTLLELTAVSVVQGMEGYRPSRIAVCGGGAHNPMLIQRLEAHAGGPAVISTSDLGIHPDWVEAATFAWLAHQTLEGLSGNEPGVTGAQGPRVLGAIYPA